MSFLYYEKAMKALWENHVLTPEELRGKDVLVVGLAYCDDEAFAKQLLPFFAAEVNADYIPVFTEHIDEGDFPGRPKEVAPGKKYDFIVLLEGLERTPHFAKGAAALANICRPGGTLLLLVQTPDASAEALDGVGYLEPAWAYDLQDVESLFPGFSALYCMRSNPAFLLAVKLEKRREEKPSEATSFSLRLQRRVGEREGLQAGFFHAFEELERIGAAEFTDKCCYRHNYLPKYEFFLRDWKDKPLRLLELGVCEGASERMWKKYFPQAEIYGVDIEEECRAYAEERIEIRIGDLSKTEVLESLKEIRPHIIVDDASHIWSHQLKALFTLFPALPSGGIYILEDLETSFYPELFSEYRDAAIDAYTAAERIARVAASRKPCTEGPFAEEITAIGMATELVATMLSSCIFIKK